MAYTLAEALGCVPLVSTELATEKVNKLHLELLKIAPIILPKTSLKAEINS